MDLRARVRSLHARLRSPATPAQIAATERALELTMPDELRALYAVSDGLVVERLMDVEILSLDELVEEARPWRAGAGRAHLGFLPLVRAPAQGDRFAVLTTPPLRGRICWVPTDESPELRFDSLASLLEALEAAEADEDEYYDIRDLRMTGPWRTDARAARALFDAHLADAERPGFHDHRALALQFAITLASTSEVDALERAIDVGDLRRSALAVLGRLEDATARAALRRFDERRARFVAALLDAARTAGHAAKLEEPTEDDPEPLVTVTAGSRERYLAIDELVPPPGDADAFDAAVRSALAIATRPR